MQTNEVFTKVTDKLIQAMENGVVPWAKPWRPAMSVHGHVYRGINAIVLGFSGYASPIWLTFNQAKQLGGSVRKGEKGTPVLLWKRSEKARIDAETGEETRGFYATTFTVFNLEQTEGVTLPKRLAGAAVDLAPAEAAEAVVSAYRNGPAVEFGGDVACYVPKADRVLMPHRASFTSSAAFYSTLFHELTHSTGAANRLAREGVTDPIQFGSHKYSKEELVAEFGAAFLCGITGIENTQTVDNSAAYLKHWLGKLQNDRKLLVHAASAAQKAVDMIAGLGATAEDSEAA